MERKYRVGIVGAGIGRHHAMAFQELGDWFEVCTICDLNEQRALALASQCDARAITSYEELLGQKDLDIIDICTPSYLHAEQTHAALAAGKHVILEKPAVGSLREMDELIRAERSSGRRLMTIFQQRF